MHFIFFFNDTATTEIYTLSLHDALPILDSTPHVGSIVGFHDVFAAIAKRTVTEQETQPAIGEINRSEEHTSELQSQSNLVCRLLLEKKKKHIRAQHERRRMHFITSPH